ncbi:PAS domain-containing protein [Melittangium boletus]|uniref:histidine kinase n=1 Tax=Melittangium boletus DSM 14713 TaxID=1294270 RepID=A0A250I7J9_9BACT|nr:PAS domain-containing protein [Melittangium boletus]ATB27170.1 Cyanobacterial phytochrome A [Melittangium boletus DSM 14713]
MPSIVETPRPCVLLVDDDHAHLAALEALLAPLGQRWVRADSGREALRCVLEEDFAVILLDVHLGDMSGLAVLESLRERERTRRTPVLLMTDADADPEEALRGYERGAVDCLTWPLVPQVVRAKVGVFVELWRAGHPSRLQEEEPREPDSLVRRREERLEAELRSRTEALNSSEERLRLAVSATALGTWDFNPVTRELRWDARCKELLGVAPDVDVTYELFISRVRPEDREASHAAVERSLDPRGTGHYDMEYRSVAEPGQEPRWLRATGRAYFEQGRAVRFIGTLRDVSVYKLAEEERSRLLAEARHRAEQLRGLTEASVALHSAEGLSPMLTLLAERARDVVGAHQCVVSLSEGAKWEQVIIAVSLSDKYAAWREYASRPDGSGIYSEVCRTNRPLRLTQAELEAHPAWKGFGAHASEHPPMRGWLAVPLVNREGHHLGLIQLSDKTRGEFSGEDEAVVVQLAQIASVAVENKRLYELARTQRRNLLAAFMQLPEPLSVMKGPDFVYEMVNTSFQRSVGERAVVGLPARQVLPELEGQRYFEPMERVYHEGVSIQLSEVALRWRTLPEPTPREGFFNISYQPLRDMDGRVEGIISVAFDVTEQVRARREVEALAERLSQSEKKLRALANSMPQLAWISDSEGQVLWYNDRWYEYTGSTPEEMLAGKWRNIYHAEELPRVWKSWSRSVARGELWEDQFRLRAADGSWRWFLTRALPLRDAEGRIIQWFGTNTDIHEERRILENLRRAEEEIRQLNSGLEARVRERTAQLQEANQELESFSYSVSHDLRAPLRHIIGFAQLLERRAGAALDDVARGHLRTITNAAQQGGMLVDDLLAFSRMGRAELRQTRVDLGALVQEVRRELEPESKGRQIEWRVGELPAVKADPSLLRQVLRNLLGNAVKYTRPRAQALIEVGARSDEAEAEVWVRDNGVGFEMQYVDKLFGVFQRLHTAEQFEGTGIGLANVRRIISRHGGRTWAEGAPEQGATFHFTLPRATT